MSCLFCDQDERSYTPSRDIEYICSICVLILLSLDQEQLKALYTKAVSKGYEKRKKAIESFFENKGDKNEPGKNDRHNDRKRIDRNLGHEEVRHQRIETESRLALL